MALTYGQLSSITEKKFLPRMYDNIFDSNPLLARAKKNFYRKLDGGESIQVPLNYATTSSSGWYAGADTLSTNDSDTITAANYSWKQLYAKIAISRADELKNAGDAGKVNLVKSKMKIAEKTMADSLGTGLYNSGATANAIIGLRDIVATDQTVGGISQTSYSWWAGNVDSSTTTLTIASMQAVFNDASVDSEIPSVIMMTRANLNRYHALLQANQRFVDSDAARGGFTSLLFNGKACIADSHCPANHIFYLNEDHLHLFVHKQEDFRMEPFASPINQNVKVAGIYWMGALGSSNNRLHGVQTALTA